MTQGHGDARKSLSTFDPIGTRATARLRGLLENARGAVNPVGTMSRRLNLYRTGLERLGQHLPALSTAAVSRHDGSNAVQRLRNLRELKRGEWERSVALVESQGVSAAGKRHWVWLATL